MTVRALTPTEEADFSAWRWLALRRMPYLASILFKVVPLFSDELPTFAVDNRWRLYLNFEWARAQSTELVAQALCHESGHLLGNHSHFADELGVPLEKRIQWNIAGDCAINDDLRDAGCAELAAFGVLPGSIGAPDYQTPQVYYRHLDQNPAGQPQAGGDGCGSGSGGETAPGELDGDQTADGDQNGSSSGVGDVEAEITRIAAAQAIRDQASMRPGSVPGGMVDIADAIMRPNPIPWQRLLSSAVRRPVAFRRGQSTYTYRRVSRRRHNVRLTTSAGHDAGRAIFPGTVEPKVSIAYVRDTSGSMSRDQLSQLTAEVETLSARMGIRGDELLIMDADTRVHTTKRYTGRATMTEVTGRGGTDMAAAIEYVWGLRHRPAVIIVATDGETGWPGQAGPVPVVALVVTEDGGTPHWGGEPPEWIRTIHAQVNR